MRQTDDDLLKRIALAGVLSSIITLANWLAYNDKSPLYGILYGNSVFRIIEIVTAALNIIPIMVGAWLGIIISKNAHNINPVPIYVLMFVQWFFVVFLISGRILKRFHRQTQGAAAAGHHRA